jgi:hypothetical protein
MEVVIMEFIKVIAPTSRPWKAFSSTFLQKVRSARLPDFRATFISRTCPDSFLAVDSR